MEKKAALWALKSARSAHARAKRRLALKGASGRAKRSEAACSAASAEGGLGARRSRGARRPGGSRPRRGRRARRRAPAGLGAPPPPPPPQGPASASAGSPLLPAELRQVRAPPGLASTAGPGAVAPRGELEVLSASPASRGRFFKLK